MKHTSVDGPSASTPTTALSLGVRPKDQRGLTRTGWLESRHSFSFGGYMDPRWMGFGPLRVINDDWIAPGSGFPTHGHRDMEIVTFVLDGALEHRDSTGGGGVLRPGQVQAMSAGSGIEHSEFNASKDHSSRFLQVWIEPARRGTKPAYRDADLRGLDRGKLLLVASGHGEADALPLLQDARVYSADLETGAGVRHALAPGRRLWLQVATGALDVGGLALGAGDGAFTRDLGGGELEVLAREPSRLILFDLG